MASGATSSAELVTPPSSELAARYRDVRGWTESLCRSLEPEDYVVQSMPDASPAKWHLAHTTWFFETFILQPATPDYAAFDPQFGFLFNSYYNAVGDRHPRPKRGLLTRPTVEEVYSYREQIDEAMLALLQAELDDARRAVVEIGLNHEQQHQELLLTDLKHLFSQNPLRPAYRQTDETQFAPSPTPPDLQWTAQPEDLYDLGHAGGRFCYDNETPRHQVFLQEFELASRLVTNAEYLRFIEDGGYRRSELWLSDGWDTACRNGWEAPLYWERRKDDWWSFTLQGMQPLDAFAPVCHVSFYEADAYARWAGARLPRESEWETIAASVPVAGNLLESERFQPVCAALPPAAEGCQQMFGDVWEWTASPYAPYPGYRPPQGALGEYNGKFMCNQMVLRGGSCATATSHIRPTYRNFFYPDARWQFSGIRLALDSQNH